MSTPAKIEKSHHVSIRDIFGWWLGSSIKAHIMFLILLPCGAVWFFIASGFHSKIALWLIGVMFPIWLVLFVLLLVGFFQRIRYPTKVVRNEDGLELKTPFSKVKIAWSAIKNHADTVNGTYLLMTEHGDFFLSEKLSEYRKLYDFISEQAPPPISYNKFDFAYCTDFDRKFGILTASITILIACITPFLNAFVLEMKVPDASMMFFILLIIIVFGFLPWWLQMFKIPSIVQFDSDRLHIRTWHKDRIINIEQIMQIKQFGPNTLLITSNGWYLLVDSAKKQNERKLSTKLLELRKKLPSRGDSVW